MSHVRLLFQALQRTDLSINAATCELVQVGSFMFNMFTLVTFRSWRQTRKTGIEIMISYINQ